MTEQSRKYLSDISRAIELIGEFISETPDFQSYSSDLKTQSAVERQLAIIGEALNKFQQSEPLLKIDQNKKIIGFRNRLIHAYDSIDNSIVWAIIHNHLPNLKTEIESLNR